MTRAAGLNRDLNGRGFPVGGAGTEARLNLARRQRSVVKLQLVNQAMERVVERWLGQCPLKLNACPTMPGA